MGIRQFGVARAAVLALVPFTGLAFAQTTHVIQVTDNAFTPANITIEAGDTVRWVNAPGGNPHNLRSDEDIWGGPPLTSEWEFAFTFPEDGEYGYYCFPHRSLGMRGTITVGEGNVEEGLDINAGLSGNWWNGLDRSGEGVQIEVSAAAGGALVWVATVYSYGPDGGQIFLIAVGTPDGDTVEVDVFITDGGVWGEDFDPANIVETPWGSGVFTANDCESVSMALTPNADFLAAGYSELAYDLIRLTTPIIDCPYVP
jgi:plastocyanin